MPPFLVGAQGDSVMTGACFIRNLASAHFASVRAALDRIDLDAVERVANLLRRARDSQATVYIAGNGGSASTASHWVNDLGKATKRSGRLPIRAMCLSDNISWFSALGNDEGYERVFAGQLENFAEPNDVMIVITASGNSVNLIEAVELGHKRGVTTVGLLGFDGGKLKNLVNEMIWVRSEKGAYELVEDAHSVISHAITRCLVADHSLDIR